MDADVGHSDGKALSISAKANAQATFRVVQEAEPKHAGIIAARMKLMESLKKLGMAPADVFF